MCFSGAVDDRSAPVASLSNPITYMLLDANLDDPAVMIRSVSCFGPAESLARCVRCYSRYRYARIAFFALAAIGSASLTALNEISLAHLLFPSASFPTQRENPTAA